LPLLREGAPDTHSVVLYDAYVDMVPITVFVEFGRRHPTDDQFDVANEMLASIAVQRTT
jgi:hypothetical protein